MKPNPDSYIPYFQYYIDLVPSDNVLEELRLLSDNTIQLLKSLPAEKENYRYAEGKWTVKELIVHCIDCERVFQYRALAFARGDQQELPGFDEDGYASNSFTGNRSMENILSEYRAVRESTMTLFESFPDEVWNRIGSANGGKMSVRAAAFIICGHELHHLGILKERYL